MQCFQKDPNLRVSARKLLKHPWIVNAKRSDAVVPKKPTEYDEAVKSVQEWNEALKSPNAGSLRKVSRPLSSSPIPGRREAAQAMVTQARAAGKRPKSRVDTEQFRSPSTTADDNWDDDFDSAISPTALQLAHLKPHDNFGGLLSSEKLKAFASFEAVVEEPSWDESTEGIETVRSPIQLSQADPLETIRPTPSKSMEIQPKQSLTLRSLHSKRPLVADHRTSTPNLRSQVASTPVQSALLSARSFVESEEEDYSDLIVDDTTFHVKLGLSRVCCRP